MALAEQDRDLPEKNDNSPKESKFLSFFKLKCLPNPST